MKELYEKFKDNIWGSVVHVGCGNGEWLKYLRQLDKGFELYGITRDSDNIIKLREANIRAEAMLLENILVFVDRRFDTICCFDVLTDFVNRHGLLRCLEGLMDKESRLLIRTTNLAAVDHLNTLFKPVAKIDDSNFVYKKAAYAV